MSPPRLLLCSALLALGVAANPLAGKTLTVTTALHDPFIRLNNANGSYYEGFLVDLLSLLKRRLEFNTVLAPQQRYGQQDGAGVWNGMMGEVVAGRADFALADLTITAARERAVDFTVPFMHVGVTTVFAPGSWQQQASLQDLLADPAITFACFRGGSTEQLLQNSQDPLLSAIWARVVAGAVMVRSNEEGVQRARAGRFAFLLESPSAERAVAEHCELSTVGGLLSSKGYGIAVAAGSPYRESLGVAVLEMLEAGEVAAARAKWWPSQQCAQSTWLNSIADYFF